MAPIIFYVVLGFQSSKKSSMGGRRRHRLFQKNQAPLSTSLSKVRDVIDCVENFARHRLVTDTFCFLRHVEAIALFAQPFGNRIPLLFREGAESTLVADAPPDILAALERQHEGFPQPVYSIFSCGT